MDIEGGVGHGRGVGEGRAESATFFQVRVGDKSADLVEVELGDGVVRQRGLPQASRADAHAVGAASKGSESSGIERHHGHVHRVVQLARRAGFLHPCDGGLETIDVDSAAECRRAGRNSSVGGVVGVGRRLIHAG